VPGIHHTSSSALLVFVVVLTICNVVLGTALRLITFPLKLLTLGVSSLVISLAMVYITDRVVTGVNLDGIIPVATVAVVTGIIAMAFRAFR
jgi:putative membrane protein